MPALHKGAKMVVSKGLGIDIETQQRAITHLKREIFGIDKTSKSVYIKEFDSDFVRYKKTCTVDEVMQHAASSDIVYFGDYHPLRASQNWVLRFMKELDARGRKVVLALEMLYVHQQEFLDRWMKGTMSEEQFLEAIDYQSEWGFDWKSYRRIFEFAKDPFIPIFGIDSEPRDNLRYMKLRDRMIARRIKTIHNFFPDHEILVVIGESHLASNHLPAEVRKVCKKNFQDLIIVQNVDSLYWRLRRQGKVDIEAVRIDNKRYCLFTASPMVKYQSYCEIINHWVEGEEEDRYTQPFQEMVEHILLLLFGKRKELTVTVNGEWRGTLEEVFPTIHRRKTYKSVSSYLRSKRVHTRVITAVNEQLKNYGACYVPVTNSLLVMKFDPVFAAQEAARFVLYAMRDEISHEKKIWRPHEDQFYAFIFEEALVYLGSKIISSTHSFKKTNLLLNVIDSRGVVRKPVSGFSLSETREIVGLLKYHIKRENRGRGAMKNTRKLQSIFRLAIRKRLLIVRTLGHSLGEAISKGYAEGRVSRKEILVLFHENFREPGRAKRMYLDLVKRTKPFREMRGEFR